MISSCMILPCIPHKIATSDYDSLFATSVKELAYNQKFLMKAAGLKAFSSKFFQISYRLIQIEVNVVL